MSEGYGVDPQRLRATGEGIDAVIGELAALGLGAAARTGRNFGALAPDGVALGHAGLTAAVAGFCDRWSWGVRGLVQEGSELARQLGLAAGSYHESEQYGEGMLKDLLGSLAGDPHATDEQLESASSGQLLDGAASPPDLSTASAERAAEHIGATWSATGADVADTVVDRLDTPLRIASALSGRQLPEIPAPGAEGP